MVRIDNYIPVHDAASCRGLKVPTYGDTRVLKRPSQVCFAPAAYKLSFLNLCCAETNINIINAGA